MAYEVSILYHLHMPFLYFLIYFTWQGMTLRKRYDGLLLFPQLSYVSCKKGDPYVSNMKFVIYE